MDMMEAMEQRHSVRNYEEKAIEGEALRQLEEAIRACNQESGLHIQLVRNEPKAFSGMMARYGKFSGVTNYVAMIGKKGPELDELCGYYGEKIVLKAQTLGLCTCWTAMTYKKIPGAFTIGPGEKLAIVIAIGYGKTKGTPHRSKAPGDVSEGSGGAPDWFKKGVEAALLAPTAMNQQKFRFTWADGKVAAKAGMGFYTKIDLGIAKCHFELGAGMGREIWK